MLEKPGHEQYAAQSPSSSRSNVALSIRQHIGKWYLQRKTVVNQSYAIFLAQRAWDLTTKFFSKHAPPHLSL